MLFARLARAKQEGIKIRAPAWPPIAPPERAWALKRAGGHTLKGAARASTLRGAVWAVLAFVRATPGFTRDPLSSWPAPSAWKSLIFLPLAPTRRTAMSDNSQSVKLGRYSAILMSKRTARPQCSGCGTGATAMPTRVQRLLDMPAQHAVHFGLIAPAARGVCLEPRYHVGVHP